MLVLYILGYLFLYLVLFLLIVVLAVLLIPFRYHFTGEKLERTWFEASVAWLFGGIKLNIHYNTEEKISSSMRILGIRRRMGKNQGKNKDISKAEKKDEKQKKREKSKAPYSYLTIEVLEKTFQCVLKLLNHCKPDKFQLRARVGFDDPMYTGLLCAVRGTGFAILDKYDIRFQPNFEEEELKGSLTISGRIQLFYLLLVAMEFVFTRPFRTILIKNLKTKIKRRVRRWQTLILKKT
ncbi:MAG: hypothetical protein K0R50_1835 [Eubacterium sp.]|jgi:hypothetical protein|nr:hypothetical protein [Eubacterium sp.]